MIQIWYSGDAAHHPSEHEFGVAVHNAVPSIASIAPATGVAGTFVDVTIHGSQFEPGSTVSLAEKNGIATQFVSPAELRVKLDLSRYQFATTVWLRVAAPDGDASNEVQFAITMPPRDPNVMLDFDEHGASALVTRGANSVWLTGLNGLRSIRDDDEDGVVLWPWSYPYAEMWAVVDVASGRWDVRGSYGGAAPPAGFAPHTFIRDAAGVVSQFVLRVPGQAPFGRSRWYLLWVRPGVGAWMNVITDGDDADRSINGVLFGSTREMLPYGPAVKTPDGFATGDVLIAMRSDNAVIGTTMAATLDDELIDGASGVLQFVSTFDNSMTAVEGKSDSATALVIRTDGGEGTVTVNYATAPVSAYGQQSYVHTTGTLTFAPGETVKAIAVPLVNDDMYVEGVFDIVLSNPSGATLGTGTTMRVHVQDNDPRPTVAAAGPNPRVVRETDSPQTVDVQLVIAAKRFGSVSVPWTLRKYPSSEIEASCTAYFGEGQQVAMISFPLPGDIENTRDWDYELSWKGPYDSRGTLRIVLQDDDAPVVTAPNVAVLEAQQSARVRLSIQKPLSHPLRVDYATANATATSPGDYTSTTGSVVFAAGEMHREFAIAIANDQHQEDDETFSVELSWIADVPKRLSVSVSVLDDDGPARPRAAIAGTTAVESSGAAQFEVRLSAASADVVTIFYSTADGT
ncbi:MAG TPA: Calx-beta domain-containing protein, partial [Thermoanaerobaculia bacterium]|nr:Calx-beta domain-containing protein [Thermoanaerobaculia bacterium]